MHNHPPYLHPLYHQPGAIGLITLLRANLDNEILCWRVPRALRELAIKDEEARQQVRSTCNVMGSYDCGSTSCDHDCIEIITLRPVSDALA